MIQYDAEFNNQRLSKFGFKNPVDLPTYKIKTGEVNIMANEKWKKIESQVFKFEKIGDEIEGKLVSKERSGSFDNMNYKIETTEGLKTVFGTVVLDSNMSSVETGKNVRIVLTDLKENKKKGQNPTRMFDVFTQ